MCIVGLAVLNLFYCQPLDMLTLLGFVILIGIVVDNAILLVHQTLLQIRQDVEAATRTKRFVLKVRAHVMSKAFGKSLASTCTPAALAPRASHRPIMSTRSIAPSCSTSLSLMSSSSSLASHDFSKRTLYRA